MVVFDRLVCHDWRDSYLGLRGTLGLRFLNGRLVDEVLSVPFGVHQGKPEKQGHENQASENNDRIDRFVP